MQNGDTIVLTVGSFGDFAEGDAGGTVFLDDGGDFSAMTGPTGENFVALTQAGAGPPGPYNIVLTGAELASSFGNMPACGGTMPCDNPIGDLSGDGEITLLDVAPFVQAIQDGKFNCEADINEDGNVDLLDVNPFITLLL